MRHGLNTSQQALLWLLRKQSCQGLPAQVSILALQTNSELHTKRKQVASTDARHIPRYNIIPFADC